MKDSPSIIDELVKSVVVTICMNCREKFQEEERRRSGERRGNHRAQIRVQSEKW